MRATRFLALVAVLSLTLPASAANTQAIADAARERMLEGVFQVPASACSGAGAPSACCTGAGAGATCPVYKLALVTAAATYNASSTTFAGTNEVANGNGYTTGGATLTATSAANYVQTDGDADSCVHFTTPVTWTTATFTANAAILYCESNCATDNAIIGVYCLDGSTCATDKTASGGDFVVNLANTVGAAMYCITN